MKSRTPMAERPLRIVMVSQTVGRNDGQGRVNYEIVLGALAEGHHVTIVAMNCAKDCMQDPRAKFVPIRAQRFPTQLLKNIVFGTVASIWIERHRREIDVLHVNGCVTWSRSQINAAHFVHTAWIRSLAYPFKRWWESPYIAYQRLYSAINAEFELREFLRAQAIVAVSAKVKTELQEAGVPADRIVVIQNGVDTDEFRPGPPERERFGLPQSVPLFLFAGDIRIPRKNLDTVLLAMTKVPEAHLAVAGSTLGSPFLDMAASMRLDSRVHFLGQTNEMPSLMRSVDALVFPSRYDPAGLVILEAMSSGIPVITSKTAGAWEIVGLGGRVLDDPEDFETLATWMSELATDRELCRKIGGNGRVIALNHSWRTMAAKYCALYRAQKSVEAGNTMQRAERV